MAVATPTKTRKEYNPNMTIRLPRPVRDAVQAIAKKNNETVTDFVLQHIEPFVLYASPEGQEAFERIRQAITESTTIHKHLPEGEHEAWLWCGLDVRNYGTNVEPFLVHIVKQYEGTSREEAVRNYTEKVWKEWSLAPVQDREAGLAEITDPTKHLFLVAYVNFKAWKKFPSTYEASLHRSFFVEGTGKNIYKSEGILAEPEGTEEVQFYTKAHTALRRVVENLEAFTSKREGLILPYYTHVSKEENLEAWAKHVMWLYKNKGEEWLVEFLQSEPKGVLLLRAPFDWNKVAFTVEVLEVGSN
jgi:hypothetical protein